MERINGLTRKFHLYQAISYGFFICVVLSYYLIIFSLSSNLTKVIGGTLEAIAIGFVLVSGYIATATDPSDPYLQLSRKARFERTTYAPPKKEFYCTADHTYVKSNSKHCRRCNRCTEEFDHHCKWINNDVGKANYKSFFVLITSVMVLLTVYLVCSIIVTIDYAADSTLRTNDIFIYGENRDQIILAMVIMWVFMGLVIPFLLLDANLVLFHIFLMYKGLTTFQYITAVEERKEHKKELEYAMKILGGKKSTCLDFILCLNKRRNINQNNFAKPQETPNGGEQELAKISQDEQKQLNDQIKETKEKPSSKVIGHDNTASESAMAKTQVKENDLCSPEFTKNEKNENINLICPNEPEKNQHDQVLESGRGVQPLVLKIERDHERKRTEKENTHHQDDHIKTTALGLSGDISPDFKLPSQKDKTPLNEIENMRTPQKHSWQDHICLEIDPEQEGEEGKHNKPNNLTVSHPRASTYSVEKEKVDVVGTYTETYRSNHTPILTNLKKATKFQPGQDSQRIETNRLSVSKRGLNDSNDIAIETFRASVGSAI